MYDPEDVHRKPAEITSIQVAYRKALKSADGAIGPLTFIRAMGYRYSQDAIAACLEVAHDLESCGYRIVGRYERRAESGPESYVTDAIGPDTPRPEWIQSNLL